MSRISFEDIVVNVIATILVWIAIGFSFVVSPIVWLLGLKKK